MERDLDIDRADLNAPEYGFKGNAIYFCKTADEWSGSTNEGIDGSFPNQKISIHKMLNDTTGNPLAERCPSNQLRYFHLPANNMRWVEKAMSRYYGELDGNFDHYQPAKQMSRERDSSAESSGEGK
ncbi:hypothetical protein BKA65DRAFT_579223 [Rhexocercosporidium sp. MPI-PUGE-AT-0058]|nr:hypothetical protein BKA65DRAFT_579223 [Rhexocercosporidium sp. MPI-PUGE-AT-0058]